MPRFGVVTARRKAGSSSGLTSRRNQAHRSLISARSKKLCPPTPLYGICAARASLEHAAWWLARYSTAKSAELRAAAWAAQAWMRATALGLVLLAVAFDHAHRLAVAELAPQLLLEQLGVGAITLLAARRDGRWSGSSAPADDLQLGEVPRQRQVVERGAAPAVDALVVVAHAVNSPPTARPAPSAARTVARWCPGIRRPAHVAECWLCHLRRAVGARCSSFSGRPIRSSKSTAWKAAPAAPRNSHHAWRRRVRRRPGLRPRPRRRPALVLPQADGPLPAPRPARLSLQPASVAQHAQHVVAVEDRELRLQARARAPSCAACARQRSGRC